MKITSVTWFATWMLISVYLNGCAQTPPLRPPDPQRELTLEELKAVYASEPDPERKFLNLSQVVRRYSYESLRYEIARDAQSSANQLLFDAENFTGHWNYSNAVHHAELVLGRLRLQGGDVAGATRYLNKAGSVKGSPQLNSYGPNMTLAKEMLEKGQREAVLSYLKNVERFWEKKYSAIPLSRWREAIEDGKSPDFGESLVY